MTHRETILFVYGTLKRRQVNHHLIADQHFLGEAITQPIYRLLDLGPYPGLVCDERDGLAVSGELWRVSGDCLRRLDEFEGSSFSRGPVALAECDRIADAYFWQGSVVGVGRTGSRWPFDDSTRD